MMLQNSIKTIISDNNDTNPMYLRNLIKEELQNYILHFIYTTSLYNHLLFTGGTCLRKVYGINRLSEDLDFDYIQDLNIDTFAQNVVQYFKSSVQYPSLRYLITGNKNTVIFKLPILKELEQYSKGTPEDLFIRCDFSKEDKGGYRTDNNMIKAGLFQFFITSYDLSTMFANKFKAFLERSFYKGSFQKVPFKGRDVYDLFWLIQLSAKSSFSLKINTERLMAISRKQNVDELIEQFKQKIKLVEPKFVYDDLLPILDSKPVLDNFLKSYQEYLPKYIDFVF